MLDSELFMNMLNNKEAVVKAILVDIQTCQQNQQAFDKLERLFAEGKGVSTDKVMKACSKSLQHLNEVNTRLLMLALVYASGGNYDSDVGKVLIKLGRGQEALQSMFKRKMAGG